MGFVHFPSPSPSRETFWNFLFAALPIEPNLRPTLGTPFPEMPPTLTPVIPPPGLASILTTPRSPKFSHPSRCSPIERLRERFFFLEKSFGTNSSSLFITVCTVVSCTQIRAIFHFLARTNQAQAHNRRSLPSYIFLPLVFVC